MEWTLIADDAAWGDAYDMVWAPVFSQDSKHVGAKVEKNGRYTVAIDGKAMKRDCQAVWDPIFSPDGTKVLVRSVEGGRYIRRVLPVTEITG